MKVWKITKTKVKYRDKEWMKKAIRKGKLSPGDRINFGEDDWTVLEAKRGEVLIRCDWDDKLPEEVSEMVADSGEYVPNHGTQRYENVHRLTA